MMNTLKLSGKWREHLVNQPETGMGFQDVEVTLADGRKVDGLALNGETLETVSRIAEPDIAGIRVRTGGETGRWAAADPRAGCCVTKLASTGKRLLVSGGDHNGEHDVFECQGCQTKWYKDGKGQFWKGS